MFFHFFSSVIILILLQYLNYSESTISKDRFPSVPGVITKTSFPINLTVNFKSDVIIVKCPTNKYKHSHDSDVFNLDRQLSSSEIGVNTTEANFFWVGVAYNYLEPKQHSVNNFLECGNITTKNEKSIYWQYNFKWENKPNILQNLKLEKIPEKLSNREGCDTDPKKIIVYSKCKQGMLGKHFINDYTYPAVGTTYYYFVIPDETDKIEMKEPCSIVKAVFDVPELALSGYNLTERSYAGKKIYFIQKKLTPEIYSIDFYAPQSHTFNFEKVNATKMKYHNNDIIEVPNTTEEMTHSITVEGYQIIKLSYDCLTLEGIKTSTRIFYFGPDYKNYEFPNEDILYVVGDSINQPNCTIDRFTFGILESVSYNNEKVNLKDLQGSGTKKGNFKRSENYVFFTNTKKALIKLKCIYINPNGKMITSLTFIRGKKRKLGKDKNGKDSYVINRDDSITEDSSDKPIDNAAISFSKSIIIKAMLIIIAFVLY
ncbi:Hypothetical protein SRAE_1000269400 [Strongyloides ratti]|uniref:6-cysteine protein n=1 Tax=Strongyloides ratti TaxID=34506 RepID=A0A090LA88_STRRB|nr:Hypothetical protein SRAE_1000269400 [Strongyloides ratti]CEF64440.1 Hypothetical protein SRAE_1000269400 [Strongyloides ratti]